MNSQSERNKQAKHKKEVKRLHKEADKKTKLSPLDPKQHVEKWMRPTLYAFNKLSNDLKNKETNDVIQDRGNTIWDRESNQV